MRDARRWLPASARRAPPRLDVLERHLEGREWLVGDGPTVADVGLYAYVHLAPDADVDLGGAVRAWLGRVEALPGFQNDLEPYPPSAQAEAGGASVHGR